MYWRRRLAALGTVAAVAVFTFVVLHTGAASNSPLSATLTPSATSSPSSSPTPQASRHKKKAKKAAPASQAPASLSPDGPCDVSTLVVVPLVPEGAQAKQQLTIGLSLTTTATTACSFEITPDSIVARILRGTSRVWSTQDCPDAIPDQMVTVGPHTPGIARLVWSSRTSSAGCPAKSPYAKKGSYLIQVAAYGSLPGQMKFDLAAPPAPGPTASPTGGG